MKIILLSGGSGKRLWPLSNDSRSKQFLKVLSNEEGASESMIQRIERQIKKCFPQADILVATSEPQMDAVRRQLPSQVKRLAEPSRRGTYPAILLSIAYLLDKENLAEDEFIAVLPVDSYVEQDYFGKLQEMEAALCDSGAQLCLLGVKPTYPSEKYGYITKTALEGKTYSRIEKCVEKPNLKRAKELFEAGALWNGGVFLFRASFGRALIEKEIGQASFAVLYQSYEKLPHTSFDYEVVENLTDMVAVEYDGEWNDLGTWNTLTEKMHSPDGGFVIRGEDCQNTHVINELEIPVVALGLKDSVVVASADGILVSDKHASSYLNPYVEQIHNRPMYEKRQWGEYKVLNLVQRKAGEENSLTKYLYVEPGRGLSYQWHHQRDEIWTITDGEGIFVLDGEVRNVTRGDVLYIKKEQKHAMASRIGVGFVEVQLGTELIEEDIEREPWDWTPYLGK